MERGGLTAGDSIEYKDYAASISRYGFVFITLSPFFFECVNDASLYCLSFVFVLHIHMFVFLQRRVASVE